MSQENAPVEAIVSETVTLLLKGDIFMPDVVKILSIDGGGIRGILPAKILQAMDSELKKLQPKDIASAFDLIGGTSTGGIIALGLCATPKIDNRTVRYTPSDLLSFYTENAKDIFQVQNHFPPTTGPGIKAAQYKAEGIESFLKSKFGTLAMSEIEKPVVVFAFDIRNNQLQYISSKSLDGFNCFVWEAARATSAAPTYFPAKSIQNKVLVDGGVYMNNPSLQLLFLAKQQYPDAKQYVLVSLGSGRANFSYESCINSGLYGWLASGEGLVFDGKGALFNIMMYGGDLAIDNQLKSIEKEGILPLTYYRLQPELGKKEVQLDGINTKSIEFLQTTGDYYVRLNHAKIQEICGLL
ncbi:patatin-like phospholipase family protein [Scytonema hofmannii FACHB-248]|uniref:Patatin-like phospholipase family protein n=2 Tax=Nostocales TaxID=1161 RepID=A0ABR8GYR6_9CYAN|nr:patatin-like phospholipase family protein [Scytonema hofmannii]MBD2608151.1 patatin-like phospholipase family protein [Scytonema hofmannii FACHB-248]